MHDFLVLQSEVAVSHVSNNFECLQLREPVLPLDVLLQIPIFTKLGHDVNVVLGHEYLDGAEDVGMGEGSQCVDLVVEQILLDFSLYFAEFQDLDGDGLAVEFVEAFVDVGGEAATDHLRRIVYVVLYFLYQLLLVLTVPLTLERHCNQYKQL